MAHREALAHQFEAAEHGHQEIVKMEGAGQGANSWGALSCRPACIAMHMP